MGVSEAEVDVSESSYPAVQFELNLEEKYSYIPSKQKQYKGGTAEIHHKTSKRSLKTHSIVF